MAGAAAVPTSTTRTGAIGGGVGVGGGGADEKRGGFVSATVFDRSAVPVGPRAGAAGGDDCARSWPHVTQKRRPLWFALPQRGHGMSAVVGAWGPSARCGSPRGAKFTSGADGRWSGPVGDRDATGCAAWAAWGAGAGGGCGGGAANASGGGGGAIAGGIGGAAGGGIGGGMGGGAGSGGGGCRAGGGVDGASAVAASEAGPASPPGRESPMGGVGGATRGASL